MDKHTPGPWVVESTFGPYECPEQDNDFDGALIGIPAAGHAEGMHHGAIEVWGERAHANARLVAAAPELLDALEDALCALGVGGGDFCYAIGKAREAIAKATGASA